MYLLLLHRARYPSPAIPCPATRNLSSTSTDSAGSSQVRVRGSLLSSLQFSPEKVLSRLEGQRQRDTDLEEEEEGVVDIDDDDDALVGDAAADCCCCCCCYL